MLKTLKRLGISFFVAVFIFNISLLPGADKLGQVEAGTLTETKGTVTSDTLNIRKKKKSSSKKVAVARKGDKVTLLSNNQKWVKVEVNGQTGYAYGKYIATTYGTASDIYADAVSGTVSSKTLCVRTGKSKSSMKIAKLRKGAKVSCLTTDKKWVKVKVGNVIGYTQGKYIKTEYGTASDTGSEGLAVVEYAKQFLGNPYVWGGSSLTHGTDCSGYTMSIYKHFGKSLPHSSYGQRSCGTRVSSLSKAQPGDIICYSGHVAIYMGNNRVIHASNPKDGIKITNNAAYRHIVTIRRIL